MTSAIANAGHAILRGSPYEAYVYAYPHKTAYRTLDVAKPLRDVWANESRRQLSLYMHIPFCTMRCGFCNLFTTPQPASSLVELYLDALRLQTQVVREAIPDARFTRFAIGGGTPTYLDLRELESIFVLAHETLGVNLSDTPTGIETSPDTIDREKIALLESFDVKRISIGIQSFVEEETTSCGRPQQRRIVERALQLLHDSRIPLCNIDLIYGLPNQTIDSWLFSLQRALEYQPEELFLYPLYVRPMTALGRSRKHWDDSRREFYREGRDYLRSQGYTQVSMRMFRRDDAQTAGDPDYCCQVDGMVGLGCGARSYTRELHYSLDYAVQAKGVREIITDYLARDSVTFSVAQHGFELDEAEQRIRFLLQSILNATGLDADLYRERFATKPTADFPELHELAEAGLLTNRGRFWMPTDLGLEWSDALGPWFFSRSVRSLMAEYDPR